VTEEKLGADEVPDVLMLSLSSADYIGHAYGPFSHEVQDYYLRLDAYLGSSSGSSTRLSERTGTCWR
jgi:predicted AlkP superfamily pyrophosphatase or phosphodiesterase